MKEYTANISLPLTHEHHLEMLHHFLEFVRLSKLDQNYSGKFSLRAKQKNKKLKGGEK